MNKLARVEPEAASRSSRIDDRLGLFNRHIGARIRQRRLMLGMSQQQFAKSLGFTYQQAHKYEQGLNRVSAGRLYEIAQTLEIPVGWFYEGFGMDQTAAPPDFRQRMSLELARSFALISNRQHQVALCQMAKALISRAPDTQEASLEDPSLGAS